MEREASPMTLAAGGMPWIIYGTAWKQDRTAALVEQAILAGFRGIDTACQPRHYRESLVGEALRRLADQGIVRDALYLQTKYSPVGGQDPHSIPYDPAQSVAIQVEQSLTVSLAHLRTDCLDALVLHSPLATHELTMEAWGAMEAMHKGGLVRRLGLSNCYSLAMLQQIYADALVKPALLQNRFYRDSGYDAGLREWCHERSIVYQGFWTLTANPHLLQHKAIRAIAAKYGKTAPQVLFTFLKQSDIVILTGTCSEQHMRDDLAVQDFVLAPDEMGQVELLLQTT